jgi:hypothetical protein
MIAVGVSFSRNSKSLSITITLRWLSALYGYLSYQSIYLGTRESQAWWYRPKEYPTFFPYTTRNAMICIIHYTAKMFLRKPHRGISGGQLSLPSRSESLSIDVVEVENFYILWGACDFWYLPSTSICHMDHPLFCSFTRALPYAQKFKEML